MTTLMPTIITTAAQAPDADTIAAMSRVEFVEAVAEHVYGQKFCEAYAPSMIDTHATHTTWQRALLASVGAGQTADAFNEGCKRAIDRLSAITGQFTV